MATINKLDALEILDSRGRPTVEATCLLAGGARGAASVPSGASIGAAEAVELRDGDPARYEGLGCRKAARAIAGEIHDALRGKEFASQRALDEALVALDGTANKHRLGANSVLAVSLAFARAAAVEQGVPLYRYIASQWGSPPQGMPRMTINLFSGGLHAGGQVPIQDVLIVPGGETIDEALVMATAVYRAAVRLVQRKYQMRWLTADEGGLAPPVDRPEDLFDDAVEAIRDAALEPGRDVQLAVDVAASHFYRDGRYQLGGPALDSRQMIDRVASWIDRWPIMSVEDGLAEDDWPHWPLLAERVGERALVVGDDLLCSNTARIERAAAAGACNGLLLKVNQVGTLSEAFDACRAARRAGWRVIASVRSGETEDDWFADLAVGISADMTKAGSLTQSERLAKYNRLLAIETERSAISSQRSAADC